MRSTENDNPQKEFLTNLLELKLKRLGHGRLILRNEGGIMELVCAFDGLFFANMRSGNYANHIETSKNLDMHLRLDVFTGARFDVGVSRSKSKVPTYAVYLLGSDGEKIILKVFVKWGNNPEDIALERIEAWKALKGEYAGQDDTFCFETK